MFKNLCYFFALLLSLSGCVSTQTLFTEGDFSNYHAELKNGASCEDVFSIEKGVLTAKGKPAGYLRTPEKYSNYKLHVEWRWVDVPSNAGVLLNIAEGDNVWPHNIEAQLKHGEAGDVLLVGEGAKAEQGGKLIEVHPNDAKKFIVLQRLHASNEMPVGEWNTYDIKMRHKKLTVWVNGVKMNSLNNVSPASGYIGLATLGTEIQYRNVHIKLKK